ncbi:alpha/beta hydrolase family esterase [Minwuia sp.]|uniref:alpha/beta hydrolase family esterase n=1 Tax=Minwuia sp. TaxID=2493630 RepID=UPI003A916389
MSRFLLLLCLIVLAGPALADTLRHDGRDRDYLIERPPGLALPAPTVFVLHGGGGTAERTRRTTAFHASGARAGYVTVYPQGIGNQWNDAREAAAIRRKQGGEVIDDVGFLTALAQQLVQAGIADARRIYATGASNGGMMTFRLACEAAGVFAAFAPVIANLPEKAERTCRPARPVPLMLLNGTADELILWDGGAVAPMFPADRGTTLSTDRTLAVFRALNGCAGPAMPGPERDLGGGIRLTVTGSEGCRDGTNVILYRFDGMGHRWPETANSRLPGRFGDLLGPAPANYPASREIRAFFARHPMPE